MLQLCSDAAGKSRRRAMADLFRDEAAGRAKPLDWSRIQTGPVPTEKSAETQRAAPEPPTKKQKTNLGAVQTKRRKPTAAASAFSLSPQNPARNACAASSPSPRKKKRRPNKKDEPKVDIANLLDTDATAAECSQPFRRVVHRKNESASTSWNYERMEQEQNEKIKNDKVRQALDDFFANKGIMARTQGGDKHGLDVQNLAANFCVEGLGKAFRAALDICPYARHAFIRVEVDGTSRETRGADKRKDSSTKWWCTCLSGWFADPDTPTEEWPRWDFLPANIVSAQPGDKLPDHIKPGQRNARLAMEVLWDIIEKLPKGCLVTPVVAGDAAESATILQLLVLLESRARTERPDLIWLPWAHRCNVHQATLVGEEAASLFCQLSGTTKSKLQNKIYLQVLQKRRQNAKYQDAVEKQAANSIEVSSEEETKRNAVRIEAWRQFLMDMQMKKAAQAFQGCYPLYVKETTEDGEVEESFVLKIPSEQARKRVTEHWLKLYQRLKEPRFNRWLTFGYGARVECIHEALNAAEHIMEKKPWFITAEEWKDFVDDSQIHDRYCIQKLMLAHLFAPLDAVSSTLLSVQTGCATVDELRKTAVKAFRAAALLLMDEPRMDAQMEFVSRGSADVDAAMRSNLRTDAYVSLMAAAAALDWRVTSGYRDPHEVFLEEFRRAEYYDLHGVASINAEKRPFRSGVHMPCEHQKKVVTKLLANKDKPLINEPGGAVVAALTRTLADMPLDAAVAACRSLARGLLLSPGHQAACERMIGMAKHEQQAFFSNLRGMARISANVIRRKMFNAWGAAISFFKDGPAELTKKSDDEDQLWKGTDGTGAQEDDSETEIFDEDEWLLSLKRDTNWYGEFLKTLTDVGDKLKSHAVDCVTKIQMILQSRRLNKRRHELLEQQKEKAKLEEQLQQAKRLMRERRAKVQLKLWMELRKYVYRKFEQGGVSGQKGVGEWNYRTEKKKLQDIMYTKIIPALNVDLVKVDLWKFKSTGVERFVGWIIACQVGKKKYSELDKHWDKSERVEEYEELQAEMGDEQQTLQQAFKNPRAMLVLELPPVPGFHENKSRLFTILLAERSPFSFVAAPARKVSATEIEMEDTVLDVRPFLSLQNRSYLGKMTGKKVELYSVVFSSCKRGAIRGKVVWQCTVTVPLPTVQKKDPVQHQRDPPTAPAAAVAVSADAAGAAPAAKRAPLVRVKAISFEVDEDAKTKKTKMKTAGGQNAAAAQASNSNAPAQAASSSSSSAVVPAAKKRPGKGTRSECSTTVDPDSDWQDDSESEEPMQQFVIYNMASDAERKEYLRKSKLQLENTGGCPIPEFSFELLSVCQITVRPLDEDVQYLLEKLVSMTTHDWAGALCMRGQKGVRSFHFHPRTEGWRWGFKLACCWGQRMRLVSDFITGFTEDAMGVVAEPTNAQLREFWEKEMEEYASVAKMLPLKGQRLKTLDSMLEWPDEFVNAMRAVREKNDFVWPSSSRPSELQMDFRSILAHHGIVLGGGVP